MRFIVAEEMMQDHALHRVSIVPSLVVLSAGIQLQRVSAKCYCMTVAVAGFKLIADGIPSCTSLRISNVA